MIDIKKQYRTRDGREVRIYATDGEHPWSVHGAVKTIAGRWDVLAWKADGRSLTSDADYCKDLIEVKPRIKREVWVNVYPESVGSVCKTREQADKMRPCTHDRIACVRLTIDCEEGEGL